jgi:hypothetical protein
MATMTVSCCGCTAGASLAEFPKVTVLGDARWKIHTIRARS